MKNTLNFITDMDKIVIENLINENAENRCALMHFGRELYVDGINKGYRDGCRDFFVGELIGAGIVAMMLMGCNYLGKKIEERKALNGEEEN